MARRLDADLLDRLAGRAAASVDGDEVVRLTRALVRIPSVYRPGEPGGNEAAAAAFLAGYLRGRGLAVTVHDVAPNRPNVVADWHEGGDGPGLILEGHTDVVTEGDPAAWTYPPFEAVLDGGRIYGRGTADMKGGLAAAVVALDAVRGVAHGLPGHVRLAALADEEGMMLGVKAFVREDHARGFDAALICEPEENDVCLAQKGALRVRALFRGRMAHGAMPYAGVNPLPAAAQFVLSLAEEQAHLQQRHGAHRYLGLPYITPTTIRGPLVGERQFNVIAGDAEVTVDVRTNPEHDHAQIWSALQAAAQRAVAAHPDARATLELVDDRPCTETPANAPIVKAVERAVHTVTGQPARYGGVPGATDGTFLQAWAGLPIVTIGPGKREVPHQADEYVEVDELITAARIYAATIVYFLGDTRVQH